jgi:hypothetical protein
MATAFPSPRPRSRATGSPEAVVDSVLPGPYGERPARDGVMPGAATRALVTSQIDALLHASPAFLQLEPDARDDLRKHLVHVASYAAELSRDEFYHGLAIGQRPVLVRRPRRAQAVARSQEEFQPGAANAIGRVTRDTLQAISFPTFVADLIRGTFNAIVNASTQQMEAYGQLLSNVAKTVDEFMADNISDNQARDWLAQRFPEHIMVRREAEHPVAAARETDRPVPSFRELGISEGVSLDDDTIESTLVPAARRRLAQTRHQMLATMVLMGIQRIVITRGKIRAEMNFHIDTSDHAAEQHASDFDFRAAASGSFGFGPWSVSMSTSVAYVTSNRSQQSHDMNVAADLKSEVELQFKSDYFPLERFVDGRGVRQIQGATAVPDANVPTNGDAPAPVAGDAPAPAPPPPPRRPRPEPPPLRPLGQMPPPPAPPTAPTPPARRAKGPAADAAPAPSPTPDAGASPTPDAAANPAPAPDAGASPTPAPDAAASPTPPADAASPSPAPSPPAAPTAPAIPGLPALPSLPSIPSIPSIPGRPPASHP